jgi:hypothetical protein
MGGSNSGPLSKDLKKQYEELLPRFPFIKLIKDETF